MTAARGLSRRLGAHQSGAYATPALRVRTTDREPGALAPPAAGPTSSRQQLPGRPRPTRLPPKSRTTDRFPKESQANLAISTASSSPVRLSGRTSHFVLPKQWASMRKAEALERETGKRVIHFEKGDFQGDGFRPAPTHHGGLREGGGRSHLAAKSPAPGLPQLRDAIAEEATKRGRPTVREEVLVTMGAKHALTQSLLTIVDQGDEVIFPNPGLPAGRVLDHLRRRAAWSTRRWSSRISTSTWTRSESLITPPAPSC